MNRQHEPLRVMDIGDHESAATTDDLHPAIHAFNENRDTRFHFATQAHTEALADIVNVIDDADPGIILMTGEPGCGKTLLRTVLNQQLVEKTCVCVSLESALLEFNDLLLEISSQLLGMRLLPHDYRDRYSRIAAYKEALLAEVVRKDLHLVLLLDEAQQMNGETLEGVRSLCNIGAERRNYMTPILIGQTEVRDQIEARPELAARIATMIHLKPLTFTEESSYLRHRLDAAGFRKPLPFSAEALEVLHELSRGVPRSLNKLCKMTIRQSMTRNKRIADAHCVREAAEKVMFSARWPDSCLISG